MTELSSAAPAAERRKPDGSEARRLPGWILVLALFGVMFLVYAPALLTDYLMNDEWAAVGHPGISMARAAAGWFRATGRALFGAVYWTTIGFAGYDPGRILVVRFLGFASIAGLAWWMNRRLRGAGSSEALAFLFTLVLFTQRGFLGLVGYGLVMTAAQPALWASVAALELQLRPGGRGSAFWRPVGVLLLLLLAFQAQQALALFCLAPLAWLALAGDGARARRLLGLLGLALVALAISALAYKWGLGQARGMGESVYGLGERAIASVSTDPVGLLGRAIRPRTYRSSFELLVPPLPGIAGSPSPGLRRALAAAVALAWLFAVVGALRLELRAAASRSDRRAVLARWGAVFGSLALAAVFLVIDPPRPELGHRPHLVLTFSGVVLASGVYALLALGRRSALATARGLSAAGIVAAVALVLGAQAAMMRGIAAPRANQMAFLRTELTAKPRDSFSRILVVAPSWSGCRGEPCDAWFGQLVPYARHATREPIYRYTLATLGVDPGSKRIEVRPEAPKRLPRDAVLVDWNRFVAAVRPGAD